jgi:hypothetical protein
MSCPSVLRVSAIRRDLVWSWQLEALPRVCGVDRSTEESELLTTKSPLVDIP